MTDSNSKLKEWLEAPHLGEDLRTELLDLLAARDAGNKNAELEIEDRFYRDLEFGTAGLRGILGAGTNRMNTMVVRRATQGYAEHIIENFTKKNIGVANGGKEIPRVAIAYDNRRNSDLFAFEAACVFVANGIETLLFSRLSSTPLLSWAVRVFGCDGGVVVTASHNPKQYNGYKIYNDHGCQCLDEDAEDVAARISKVDLTSGIATVADKYTGTVKERVQAAMGEELLSLIPEEFEDRFVDIVREATTLRMGVASNLSVVYTPLNGTGSYPVSKILADIGVGKVEVVSEQKDPDPDFTTAPEPNPEKTAALKLALELCDKRRSEGAAPDILIATDPDCDRVGCAVKSADSYVQLTGNQVGVLMLDYILNTHSELGTMPKNPFMITTIVSTPLAVEVAKSHGVSSKKTLTGFKYIGDVINKREAECACASGVMAADGEPVGSWESGDKDGYSHEQTGFIFGYEESCGYLAHPHVRDKDGIGTSMLLAEMAGYYKEQGKTILDRLDELYAEFGVYTDLTKEIVRPGKSGMEEIQSDMALARAVIGSGAEGAYGISAATDYMSEGTGLPPSNVVEYEMRSGGRILLRPSGTEPKLKIYYSACGKDRVAVNDEMEALGNVIEKIGICEEKE